MSHCVAVVGATGVVGSEIIRILEERSFPVRQLKLLASERSAGQSMMFRGEPVMVEELTESSFKGVDYALFSAGGSISERFAPVAVKCGTIVIDNTSYFRMHDDVPLVVPEVNPGALKHHNGIIANPNCSTAQMVLALKPIHDVATIVRIVVSTYQSVSGAGKEAMTELEQQSRANISGSQCESRVFPKPIAFNVIPQIDVFLDNGYTKEEMKMIQETKKIMGDDSIRITATAVRVPVFIGHSETINIQTKRRIDVPEVRRVLSNFPGVAVMDDTHIGEFPTPKELSGRDETFVGRIREDISQENSIEMWCVSDNLRKGAALNAVQIAECLIR